MIHRTLMPFRAGALLLLLSMAAACGASGPGLALAPASFQQAMRTPGAQVIDVRTPAEFASGHLDGAINLDWTGGVLEQRMSELDKEAPVLVYCASGRRSAAAANALRESGFRTVSDLGGGIRAWQASGLPVVGR
ncbi:MAG TPA: rhodanese-like domain-containing protein [Flavobacteriales bacterium]|nr:rhodanese-like domain-containing protein [Flavobacteriales bacterium]HMR26274.1 rhodanese-like domain-containing protein [Flavobacteriales bacterium]